MFNTKVRALNNRSSLFRGAGTPLSDPVMVPAFDAESDFEPVIVPVADPVMVPARDPVIVPALLVRDPVMVPPKLVELRTVTNATATRSPLRRLIVEFS